MVDEQGYVEDEDAGAPPAREQLRPVYRSHPGPLLLLSALRIAIVALPAALTTTRLLHRGDVVAAAVLDSIVLGHRRVRGTAAQRFFMLHARRCRERKRIDLCSKCVCGSDLEYRVYIRP